MQIVEILTRDHLNDRGVGWREIARRLQKGDLVQLRPGRFVDAESWRACPAETRILALAQVHLLDGAKADSTADRVGFGITAAAAHGLPVVRSAEVTHVVARSSRGAARRGLVRHRGPVRDDEVTDVGGILVTTVARTMADLARIASAETALCVADAALRRAGADAEKLRAEAIAISSRAAYGSRRAREILEFASPESESPGEVISRLLLVRIGFRVRIQVPVAGPNGSTYRVDFEVDDDLGEFDGASKYTDPAFLRGRTPEQALLDEKHREDWIRGRTQRRLGRWAWLHLEEKKLAGRLAFFGIHPADPSRGAFLTLGRELPAPR